MSTSIDFVNGIVILQKYFTERTKVVVIEESAVAVEYLNILSNEDSNRLHQLN